MSDEGKLLFERTHKALEKFDYYLCTVAGALFAYIVQTSTSHRLDNFFSIFQTVSLLLLAASFCCGIKRIQTANMVTRLDYEYLEAREILEKMTAALRAGVSHYENDTTGEVVPRELIESKRKDLVSDMAEKNSHVPTRKKWARRLGMAQFYFLLFGFLIILLAKVLQPYQSDFRLHSNATILTTNTPAQAPLEIQASKPAK
jgi:hypothetical protein